VCAYSKLIGWVIEGNDMQQREVIGFPCGSPMVEVYGLLTDVLICFHCSTQVSVLMYFDIVL